MKRIRIFALLVLGVLLFIQGSFAETLSLKELSDEEILQLVEDLPAELVRRKLPKTAELAAGEYIVGRDLPAGSYVYTCRAKGDDWGNLTVRANGGEGKQSFWRVVSAPEKNEPEETFVLHLNEGDALYSGVPFSLTIGAGVVFK